MNALFAYAVCRKCKWSSIVIDSAAHLFRNICEWDAPAVDISELSECPKEKERLEKISKEKNQGNDSNNQESE